MVAANFSATSAETLVTVTVVSRGGRSIVLTGDLTEDEPGVVGDTRLAANPAVISNSWAYGKHLGLSELATVPEERKALRQRAKQHQGVAGTIVDLLDFADGGKKSGYCSSCLQKTRHVSLKLFPFMVATSLCGGCGTPTMQCAAPGCPHMGVRLPGGVRIPRFCAEHRHEIPSFAHAEVKIKTLEDFAKVFEFESKNLARASKVAIGAAGLGLAATGVGLAAAPAIGGAIGATAGLSGAAASSFGLAALGGGSIAAGGFGMAGGTMVVAALGTGLGGLAGARVATAYFGQDKSFNIEKMRSGSGRPVVFASGFLTEGSNAWSAWRPYLEESFPDSPVYRVNWGAKELKALGLFVGENAGKAAAGAGAVNLALRATKAGAKKLGVIGPALIALDLAKNPWTVAKTRADATGALLGDLLARVTGEDEFILVGHSLGARVMVTATEVLSTKPGTARIAQVHLLGAAISQGGDFSALDRGVLEFVDNYHSTNDRVLKLMYRFAQAGATAVGAKGFGSKLKKIHDYDVSADVRGHGEYIERLIMRT